VDKQTELIWVAALIIILGVPHAQTPKPLLENINKFYIND
jgi:hypothetical protein